MMTPIVRVAGAEAMPDLILRAQQAGIDHYLPLMCAVHQRRIGVYSPLRHGTSGQLKRLLPKVRGPLLILIGDDDAEATGPDGWPVAQRVLRWARQVLIHASAGEPAEYAAAAVATELTGRFVLIETTSAMAPAWMDVAKRWAPSAPKHALLPPEGLHHPVPPARETMQ